MAQWSSASHCSTDEPPLVHHAQACQRPAVFLSPSCLDPIGFCVGADGLFAPGISRPLAAPYGPPPHRLHHTPLRWRGSPLAFFYYATTQRSRHLIGITLIDGQLVGNLLVRQVQSHEIQTQDPDFQRLMMSGKNSVSKIIEAFVAVVTLIALTSGFRIIKAALDDVLRRTTWTGDAIWPTHLPHGLITLDVIDQVCDIDLHRWTPVRGRRMGWHQYIPSSHSTTLESNMSESHMADVQRLSRLLIAACLAYIWVVYLGSVCEKEQWRPIIHRRKRCDLSLFQLG